MKKQSQITSLDKRLNHEYDDNFSVSKKQQELPFQDWQTRDDIARSQNILKHKRQEERQKQEINLNYPDLSAENINFRQLTEQELNKLKSHDQREYKQYLERSKWYKNQEEFKPYHEEKYKLNEMLPDDVKQKIIEEYKKFQEIAKQFQKAYLEAKQISSQDFSLSYDGTYFDLFKNLSKFIQAASLQKVGELFGFADYNDSNRDINYLVYFFKHGIRLFDINPLNFKDKIQQMQDASARMINVIKEYERRKKTLKYISKIDADVKSYLMKKDKREFLKFLDRYFPNDKRDFISTIVIQITNGAVSDWNFSVENLKKIKTFSDIYEKSKSQATTRAFLTIEQGAVRNIQTDLKQILIDKIEPRLVEIKSIIKSSDAQNMNELSRYLSSNIGIDLRSIFNLVSNEIKKDNSLTEVKNRNTNYDKITPELLLNEYKKDFIDNLKENLADNPEYLFKLIESERLVKQLLNSLINFNEKKIDYKKIESLTEKDLFPLVKSFLKTLIIKSLPNFEGRSPYLGGEEFRKIMKYPSFLGFKQIVQDTGKISIESSLNFLSERLPFAPKEFLLFALKSFLKELGASNNVSTLTNITKSTENTTAFKVFLNLLQKSGKYNQNSFVNEFGKHYTNINASVNKFMRETKSDSETTLQVFSSAIRNFDTIDRDQDVLDNMVDYIHNSAGAIPKKDLINLFSNKNLSQYNKIGIVKKVFNAYATIKNLKGIKGIYEKYGDLIKDLQEKGFVNKRLSSNMQYVIRIFNSGEPISPASPFFKKLFDTVANIETDIQTLEMGGSLSELMKNYKPKDTRVFNLDLSLNDNLRFRVLKDKDPRILRVGIESNCCQRIGGVGEISARDSFINPLSSVVILEWKNPQGEWKLLTQSYFHYVPKDNGYILDNVESNNQNLNDANIDKEAAYAYLAQKVKQNFDVGYFLAGKSYSKIKDNDFKTNKLQGGDPRFFDKDALTKDRRSFYTDFSASNNINLLSPKFNLSSRIEGMVKNPAKEAFEIHLPNMIKFALVA